MKKSLLALVLALVCASGVFAFDFMAMGLGMLTDSQNVTDTVTVLGISNDINYKINYESIAFSMGGFYGDEIGFVYDYNMGLIQKMTLVDSDGNTANVSLTNADMKMNYDLMFGLGYQADLDGMGVVLGFGPNISATLITTKSSYVNGYYVSGDSMVNMMVGLSATANAYVMLTNDIGLKVGSLFTYNAMEIIGSAYDSKVNSSVSIAPNVCLIVAM